MAAITSAAVAVAGGAYQAISSAKQAREAKNALQDLKIPELKNVAEGLQVSTLGADLKKEQGAKRFNSEVDALRSGGIRGVIGGLIGANDRQKAIDEEIAADLDIRQERIDQIRAQDEQRIQGANEQRYQNDVSALSSQYNAGQQGLMQGISGMAQGVASGAQMMQSQKNFNKMMDSGKFSSSAQKMFDPKAGVGYKFGNSLIPQ